MKLFVLFIGITVNFVASTAHAAVTPSIEDAQKLPPEERRKAFAAMKGTNPSETLGALLVGLADNDEGVRKIVSGKLALGIMRLQEQKRTGKSITIDGETLQVVQGRLLRLLSDPSEQIRAASVSGLVYKRRAER